ncbi:hypothetical protein GCM10022223_46960 [Kineosporia mesophila]|uniref:Uncharacterized protein n=1 Tax=Kineosporia mesophila TaxID=566012 RepID=A0ABP7A429_9ACTN
MCEECGSIPTAQQCGKPDEEWEILGDIARGLTPRYSCPESIPCPRHDRPETTSKS